MILLTFDESIRKNSQLNELNDQTEYIYVAKSLSMGNGYESYEYNGEHRELGDNYIFIGSPMYVTYLSIFYFFGLSDISALLLSNTILYLLLLIIVWRASFLFIKSDVVRFFLVISIGLCSSLNLYSFKYMTELIASLMLTLIIWQALLWHSKPINNKIYIIAILSGLAIHTRISFVFFPIIFCISILMKKGWKSFKPIFKYTFFTFITVMPWILHNKIHLDLFSPYPAFHAASNDKSNYDELLSKYRITDNKYWTNEIRKMSTEDKAILYNKIDNKPIAYLELYLLRFKELFRLYPSGGQYTYLPFKIISIFFQLPFLIGIILLFTQSKKYFFTDMRFPLTLFVVLFIALHVSKNLPHARYMLPMLPFGYLLFWIY